MKNNKYFKTKICLPHTTKYVWGKLEDNPKKLRLKYLKENIKEIT